MHRIESIRLRTPSSYVIGQWDANALSIKGLMSYLNFFFISHLFKKTSPIQRPSFGINRIIVLIDSEVVANYNSNNYCSHIKFISFFCFFLNKLFNWAAFIADVYYDILLSSLAHISSYFVLISISTDYLSLFCYIIQFVRIHNFSMLIYDWTSSKVKKSSLK